MRVRALLASFVALGLSVPLAFGAPASHAAAAPTDVSAFPAGVTRLSGATRYETSVAVSRQYSTGVDAAFVATGTDFPDALSAAAAAAALGGPLLLTQANRLPASVSTELKRLKPKRIFIAGGTGVVSAGVQKTLNVIAPTKRLGGADRYVTGIAVVGAAFAHADHAIIATGRAFPDALAATGAAGARHAPIVLVDGSKKTLPAVVLDKLKALGVQSISIAGGTAVVTNGIQTQLAGKGYAVTRYGGATRYATAALINRAYFPTGSSATEFLATGLDFPDALAAGALAGRLAAPLELTLRTCVDPIVNDAITTVAATSRVVMGGVAVLSQSAARNARCVYPTTSEPLSGWAVSGFTLPADVAVPYSDRPPVDVHNSSLRFDATGLLIYVNPLTGKRVDHPVAYAQYGISALIEYQRTGDTFWLNRAISQGNGLIKMHTVSRGAWWFPYSFAWTDAAHKSTLTAPWWSAMAQGQALSLFVRLAEATDQAQWRTAADNTFPSFTVPPSASAPWASLAIDHHLYFEEYAGRQLPHLVLNGHIFASFGVYDYWRLTGNATAEQYFDGAATSVLERMLPIVRVEGGVSYYCVRAEYCQSPAWQSTTYHVIHSWQLDTLARLTGDTRFTTWSQELRDDWSPTSAYSLTVPGTSPLPLGPANTSMPWDIGTW